MKHQNTSHLQNKLNPAIPRLRSTNSNLQRRKENVLKMEPVFYFESRVFVIQKVLL